MNFKIDEAVEILERTPRTLEYFLSGLSERWLQCSEGEGTWNILEVIDHLIEGERVNWIPRLEFILQNGESRPFPPFNRYAHLEERTSFTIDQKLVDFKTMRMENITKLKSYLESELDLERTGIHPEFGVVRVKELLSTWVVHDLTHIRQIVRIMANRYRSDVGPWNEYLGILKDQ